MPELRFTIRWPDDVRETCYSPSTVIREHLTPGTTYPMQEFLARSRSALTAASNRVQQRYGHPCSLAKGQLAHIETTAARYDQTAAVVFESFKE